jgi:hypothetical protein
MSGRTVIRGGLALALATCALTGCERTLVFGERTGANLGIKVDAAKSRPIEVNAGVKRDVIGIIPGTRQSAPKGEAVNLFSRFGLLYEEGEAGRLFDGKWTVRTAFASGAAAVAIAGGEQAPAAVAAIVRPIEFTLTDDPIEREAIAALFDYTGQSVANAETYLVLAEARGLAISAGSDPNSQAVGTIANPDNGAGNVSIAQFLELD